ncbi:PREDICTED: translation initiation factor IF-2-like isoform X1 [Chinchilla lanigera]|uniref:translation initiation factor IF-2-like isoform X1 n=1 Tax=Chinchilla lanigera TaxID=34839 RepID=UPI000697036C|nr:PREDICTED: translation initiation factor IF-2-like isoform X1 [Chinchilla lanigera]
MAFRRCSRMLAFGSTVGAALPPSGFSVHSGTPVSPQSLIRTQPGPDPAQGPGSRLQVPLAAQAPPSGDDGPSSTETLAAGSRTLPLGRSEGLVRRYPGRETHAGPSHHGGEAAAPELTHPSEAPRERDPGDNESHTREAVPGRGGTARREINTYCFRRTKSFSGWPGTHRVSPASASPARTTMARF